MLNPKTYQTPNAIDPGEAPPSRPSRIVRRSGGDTVEVPTVEEVRMSAARLLADDALPESRSFPHDDEETAPTHDQLPSVEEARLYAGRILMAKTGRDLSPESSQEEMQPLGRSTPITTPPYVLAARRRTMRRCVCAFFFVTLALSIAAIVVVSLGRKEVFVSLPGSPPPTSPPHSAEAIPGPISQRLKDTITFLTTYGISEETTLMAAAHTPQYRAALWIADRDGLQHNIPTTLDFQAERFVQRYIAAVFYYSLGGPSWKDQLEFLNDIDECSWSKTQALRSGEVFAIGFACNPELEIRSILIPRNNLRGRLPIEMGLLRSITFIDLNRNEILGKIPDRLQLLTNLDFLDIRYNLLSGSLPDWIGTAMPRLKELALSHNLLDGNIPETIGGASALRVLALDENDLSGDLQPLNALTDLRFLYLDNNRFDEEVSPTLFLNLEDLVHLDLSGNQLTGSDLPAHFFSHPQLKVLDLHDNDITGVLPIDIPQNSVLEFLALYDNILSGEIPLNIQNLVALTHLDVTGNALSGTIPAVLGDMLSLTYLFLSENDFTQGTIPDAISSLANLRELSLGATNRVGGIPTWIDALDKLVLVDFSRNNLVGTLPENIWNLPNLQFLLLQRNLLTGEIPDGLLGASSLEMLLLDKNNFRDNLNGECDNGLSVQFLTADCLEPNPEVACSCCTLCCGDTDAKCNDDILYANVDPKWELNYTRSSYSFSPKILFD